ncbi:MAG: hypothetical protein D6679_05670 [Candidatus Hydrogenedentota bacterium]|nr:MAG: hypothetical protein D6679_05670 [Candidatus Hydrogenedentota bacterium]
MTKTGILCQTRPGLPRPQDQRAIPTAEARAATTPFLLTRCPRPRFLPHFPSPFCLFPFAFLLSLLPCAFCLLPFAFL